MQSNAHSDKHKRRKETTIQKEPSSMISDYNTVQAVSPKYYYVPVSYLSPAVRHLAGKSPSGPTQKVELLGNYERQFVSPINSVNALSPSNSEETIRSRYKMFSPVSYSHSKSGIVQSLKENVEKDIEESEAFDKRLQDALLTD